MASKTAKTFVRDLVIDTLADLFRRAEAAALAADPGADGGSCNLDSPAFRIAGPGASRIIVAASERSGVRVTPFEWFGGKRWWFLRVTLHGQGDRRSAMMEAAQRVLNDAVPGAGRTGVHPGFRACGWYHLD